MEEFTKNQKIFKNETILKLKEKHFTQKCLECELCSWNYSLVLIPESCKEVFLNNDEIKNTICIGLIPNGIIAYY